MNKYIYIVSLFAFLFFNCQGNSNQQKSKNININQNIISKNELPKNLYLLFIGYKDNYPVFKNAEGNELYLSEEIGKLTLIKNIEKDQKPHFINDKVLIVSKENNILLIFSDGTIDKINTEGKVNFVTSNAELSKLVFLNENWELELIDLKDNSRTNTNIYCTLPQLINNNLYYLNPVEEKIYKTDINYFSNTSILYKNVLEESSLIITPDEKYIVCMGYHPTKGLKYTIINIETQKVIFPEIESGYEHYYSYQEKAIVYFNPYNFDTKVIKP